MLYRVCVKFPPVLSIPDTEGRGKKGWATEQDEEEEEESAIKTFFFLSCTKAGCVGRVLLLSGGLFIDHTARPLLVNRGGRGGGSAAMLAKPVRRVSLNTTHCDMQIVFFKKNIHLKRLLEIKYIQYTHLFKYSKISRDVLMIGLFAVAPSSLSSCGPVDRQTGCS